jgi:type 1 glutamine amidotransferase
MTPFFKVLVFSRTLAYRHASIPAGIRAFHRLAADSITTPHPFRIDDSEDPSLFTKEQLSEYRVIVLLQCSGDFLNDDQLEALKGFVRSGGGIVAVHCSSFALQYSKWYESLIGAIFDNHPEPQHGRIRVLDNNHPIIRTARRGISNEARETSNAPVEIETERTWLDEWYNFRTHPRKVSDKLHVLLAVDEASYTGGTHGEDHPVAWCQELEGGRCFYTSLGHFDEAYEDEWFIGQLYGGILWAARLEA